MFSDKKNEDFFHLFVRMCCICTSGLATIVVSNIHYVFEWPPPPPTDDVIKGGRGTVKTLPLKKRYAAVSAYIKKKKEKREKTRRKKVGNTGRNFRGLYTRGRRRQRRRWLSKGSLFFILRRATHVRWDKFLFFNFLPVSWHKGYFS